MAGLSLCALLVAGVGTLLVREGSYEADLSRPDRSAAVRPAGAAAVLRDLERAVSAGDPTAADLAAPGSEDRLSAVLANAAALGVADFTTHYVDQVGGLEPDGEWTAEVDLSWRFEGYDRRPARVEALVRFAPLGGGDGVGIVGFGGRAADGGRRTPLWLREPLSVVREGQSLVLLAGDEQDARAVSARVVRGMQVVRRVLAGWRGPAVVEVPRSAAQLDEILGAPPGTYAGVAAVTATVDGSGDREAPAHIFVNPDVTRQLKPGGAQVVMSHELVHVATGAASSTMDSWLLEGFADYVALRDVDLPDETTLARALAAVRRRGVPVSLPGPADFDTRAQHLQRAYEEAWLACRVIAETVGEDGLVRIYRAADQDSPVSRALAQEGLSRRELLNAWQRRLRDLAGAR